ncbi:MAG: type II secretion system protein GspM [Verrucomicrobiae bacterium]|nr:type II secretion system protein GspM [Verrucomicrobiae bacterium]MDW7979858.1 type II secretion system protein GspM [Verrucomicrobiales bacterium]
MLGISPEKRNQLVLVAVVTLAVLAGLYYTLINPQRATLARLPAAIKKAEAELEKMRQTIRSAQQVEAELEAATAVLAELEDEMAKGDLNAWLYATIRSFARNYKVEIPTFSLAEKGPVTLLPDFPYQQVKIGIAGTAYFHDLGRFIADFENNFPYMRVQNLSITREGASSTRPGAREKLSFRCEIVALIKPGSE